MKKLIAALLLSTSLWSADPIDLNPSEYWRIGVAMSIFTTYGTNVLETSESAIEYGQTEIGRSGEIVDVLKMIFKWDQSTLYRNGKFHLDWYWMFDVTRFEQRFVAIGSGASASLGITPVFRYSYEFSLFKPYMEFAMGAYWIAQTEYLGRDLTSNFQFGDMMVMGVYFGKKYQWSMYYKAFHHSNGETSHPNEGMGMQLLGIGYRYEKFPA